MRHPRVRLSWRIGPAVLAAVCALGSPSAADAATLTVCASGCDHTTIQAAHNAAAAGDIIEVRDAVHTELNITITKSVTVQGLGATATIVQAAATPGTAGDRVFNLPGSAGGPISVTLRRMTIRHGRASVGGGIRATGGSSAVDLRIENAILSQNQGTPNGGAINASTGNQPVNLTIVDSTIDGNTALRFSAVATFGPGAFTMTGSTVSNNTDTGGSGVGVVDLFTNFTITNSTVSGNPGGDGLRIGSVGSIVNSTVTGNGLVGIRRLAGTTTVSNSIVADNGTDCEGALTIPTGAPNLDSDGTCTGFTIQNANADLDSLADNGGPTRTHAIGSASAALDAGDDAICAAAPVNGVDQRGVARPLGDHCDLGAFEQLVLNQAPACSGASPSVASLWSPNHRMVQVSIQGVTDPEGDPVSIEIDQIRQDEPTDGLGDGNTCPDGEGIGTATASVRAERSALANGRVYTISFTASDGEGGTCQGSVKVCVPRDRHGSCVDGGPTVDSTECGGGGIETLVREPSTSHSHEKPDGLLGLLCFSHAPTLDCDLLCDVGALLCL